MPGPQDLVHVGPLQLLALHHRLVIGQLQGLVLEPQLLPGEQVLLLAGGGGTVPQPQQAHHPGHGLPAPLVLFNVRGGALLGHQSQPGPGVALLLDLAHGGPAALAVPLGGPLRTEPHQQEHHVRRQPQLVIEPQQDGQVRRGQLLPQLFLHRPGEPRELPALQGPGHVGPGVLRPLVRGPGERRRVPPRRLSRQ